jgi:RHS repeat-associated protein
LVESLLGLLSFENKFENGESTASMFLLGKLELLPHKNVGLQYSSARCYDPATGRWLSTDPISFAAGDINLYRSIGNGPTAFIDPIGNEEVSVIHGTTPTN